MIPKLEDPSSQILVVDDNEILLRAWERILSQEGFSVMTTSNFERALDYLATTPIDLLICDIVMPSCDGFELIQKTRQLPYQNRLKILLTTGYVCDFIRLKLEGYQEEVHVLLKPYTDIQALGRFIHRLLADDLPPNGEKETSGIDSPIRLWSF